VKILAWGELLVSILFLALPFWALSGFCAGRPFGYDCESWLIFGVNFLAPVGLVALVCAAWSLIRRSWRSQYFLLIGFVIAGLYGWFKLYA
jgi:hypothetical protein